MLNIWYRGGDIKVMTYAPDYFDVAFRLEWFEDDLVKKMIKDMDKSDVIEPYLIISSVLVTSLHRCRHTPKEVTDTHRWF